MPAVIRVNGETFDPRLASVRATDHGFLYGNGLFETMRAVHGHPFALKRHLARLRAGGEVIGMPVPSDEALSDEIAAALGDADEPDAYVRLTVSRGPGATAPDPNSCEAPTVMIAVKSFVPPPERWLAGGMKVEISSIRRCNGSPMPRLKSLNYMDCILAKQAAKLAGADEAMFLDTDGNIAEATAWNVFFVDGDALHTPSAAGPLLPGITREIVLELAIRAGMTCRDGQYTPLKLSMASEAFLTNSLYGVVPIGQFNGAALGDDMPGSVTVELMNLYEAARMYVGGI